MLVLKEFLGKGIFGKMMWWKESFVLDDVDVVIFFLVLFSIFLLVLNKVKLFGLNCMKYFE